MEKKRSLEVRAPGELGSSLLLRGRWVISLLMIALFVTVASCSGSADQSDSLADDSAGDEAPVESTSEGNDDGDTDDETSDDEGDAGAAGAEVEGAFAFAVGFRTGEFWAINPDTQSIGVVNTIDSETQRTWATGNGIWLAGPSELIHVDNTGEELGSLDLEGVYNLVADGGEVWVSGGSASSSDRIPYLAKLDAASHDEVVAIESQELTGEFGLFEDIAIGDEAIWLAYTLASGRAMEIDRMDRDSLEVVGTTTVPIEARSLIWDGTSLWATGWRDSGSFGVVQIAADGAVVSEVEIQDFDTRSRGWDFAVTDDGVWLASLGTAELIHLDPVSGSEVATISLAGFGQLEGLHVSDGRLWASVHQGDSSFIELTLYAIDQESNEATAVMELPERLRPTFAPGNN